jgi:hypothetical protein
MVSGVAKSSSEVGIKKPGVAKNEAGLVSVWSLAVLVKRPQAVANRRQTNIPKTVLIGNSPRNYRKKAPRPAYPTAATINNRPNVQLGYVIANKHLLNTYQALATKSMPV